MDKAVKILILNNEVEANLLDGLLRERDIPHLIRSYHDSVMDGLMADTIGLGPPRSPLGIQG